MTLKGELTFDADVQGYPTSHAVILLDTEAAWLHVRGWERETIAEKMGVGRRTVNEYLYRFRQRAEGIPDDVEVPKVGDIV